MSNCEQIEDQNRRKGKNMVVAKLEKPDLVKKYYYLKNNETRPSMKRSQTEARNSTLQHCQM